MKAILKFMAAMISRKFITMLNFVIITVYNTIKNIKYSFLVLL